jgi:hypothetical protein
MKNGSVADQFRDLFGDVECSHFSSLHEGSGDNRQGYVMENQAVKQWALS